MTTPATGHLIHPDAPAPALLHCFLANIGDAVYFKDRDSRFIAVSAALVAKHGLASSDDVLGKTDFDFFSDADARHYREIERGIMETGEGKAQILQHEHWADGTVTWAVVSKLPLRDASGAIAGTFGISQDVTASRRLQEQLETTHKELLDASRRAGMADVATGVLHNVGNVLNSVNIAADLLAEGLGKSRVDGVAKLSALLAAQAADLPGFFASPRGRQVPAYVADLAAVLAAERERLLGELGELRQSIDHIKDVVAMQQSFAASAGMIEPLDPVSLLEDSLRLNVAALVRHDIRVIRDYAPAPRVLADRSRVLQILVNLVRNAKHALDDGAPAEKCLTLRLATAGPDRVRLTVTDNGVGIPPANLERIFAHGFTTRKDGHGFGLHSAANAAGELGGHLSVHSAGLGLGAEFTLELPAAPADSPDASAARPADDPGALLVNAAGGI
ncbi:MAG: PAS domain-containing protein [Burkholderiales bacterium]|nr:PAS domain-containing protein [Opitutaceae bacterium]